MIKIISVGKIKESYLLCGIDEYKKRLNKFTKLEFIEVKDEEAWCICKFFKNSLNQFIDYL